MDVRSYAADVGVYPNALGSCGCRAGPHDFAKQVEIPLHWLSELACQEFIPIERKCRRRPTFCTVITFDGSLTGGGATLQTGISDLNEAHLSLVVAFWADQWDASDRAAMRASEHDPADQPKVEAYTLLYSIVVWTRVLA